MNIATAMLCAITAAAAVVATDARPETAAQIISGSVASMEVGDGEVRITFRNDPVNGAHDNGDYALSVGGLTIALRFVWNINGDDDAIIVTPPAGYVCEPACDLTVREGQSGSILIHPLLG